MTVSESDIQTPCWQIWPSVPLNFLFWLLAATTTTNRGMSTTTKRDDLNQKPTFTLGFTSDVHQQCKHSNLSEDPGSCTSCKQDTEHTGYIHEERQAREGL